MPVNSARELHDLINTLGMQFSASHQTTANSVWLLADQHIEHVVNEGGSWLARELHGLQADWQQHKINLQQAQHWFEHHGALLVKMAQEPVGLAAKVLAGPADIAGELGVGVLDKIGVVNHIFGTFDLPNKLMEVLHAPVWESWNELGKTLGGGGQDFVKFVERAGVTDFGKYVGGAGEVLGGAGIVFGGISMMQGVVDFQKDLDTRDVAKAGQDGASVVADAFLSVPKNPVTLLAGIAIKLGVEDAKLAGDIDWHPTYMPPVNSVDSWTHVYIPGAVDGLKSVPKKLWEAFT